MWNVRSVSIKRRVEEIIFKELRSTLLALFFKFPGIFLKQYNVSIESGVQLTLIYL